MNSQPATRSETSVCQCAKSALNAWSPRPIPSPWPPRKPVLGIDFGTSYSSAAVCVDGRVSFALDGGDAAIPTMVYVPTSGPLVVGREALRLGFSDPFNVVTSVKRLLGLGWGDPALRALDAGSSFALHQGPGGQVLIRIQKQELAPVQPAPPATAPPSRWRRG